MLEIKRVNNYVILIELFFILAISVTIVKMNSEFKLLSKNENTFANLESIVKDLRQSSETLTCFSRAYVSTGDQKFKDRYFQVLDIRNGKIPRPNEYSDLHWDLEHKLNRKNLHLDKKEALSDQISKSQFSEYEKNKLSLSENNSNSLALLEVEAFNAVEGLFKDENGEFTIHKNRDREFALSLLYSQEYFSAKQSIMYPIHQSLDSLHDRKDRELSIINHKIHKYKFTLGSLAILFIIIHIALFLYLRRVNAKYYLHLEKEIEKKTEQILLIKDQYEKFIKNLGKEFVIFSYRPNDGVLSYVSSASEKIFELKENELLNKSWINLIDWTEEGMRINLEAHNNLINGTLETDFHESQFVTKSGELKTCNIFAYSIKNISGEVVEIQGIVEDITIQKRVAEELIASKHKAEEATKAKSYFLANMSHEIRTPMNGIIGFSEVLKKSELNSQQREFVNIISKSASSLLDIINDILDFSKIESGKLDIEHVQFNLFDEFEPVVELFSAKTYEKNIKLISFIHPKLPEMIYGDALRVKQILINLIGNAIKFTPDGGVVRINISKVDESEKSVKVLFSVEDTGIGIPESKRELIFTPFSQADSSTSRKYGGTGLGLAISTKLLSLMESRLQVESEVGEGSRFFFEVEFSVENKQYPHKFSAQHDLNVAIFHSPDTEIYESLLNDYLGAFDLNSVRFSSVEELDEISFPKAVIFLTTVIDLEIIDRLKENDVSTILITDKQFELSESEKGYFNEVIHHPVNGSKIFDALIKYIDKLSQIEVTNSESNEIASFTRKSVLVVEDNDVNQQLISFMLEMLEINVDIAEDGEQGISSFKSGNYDLVLMDINMPVKNGLEATQEIIEYEKNENLQHTPIVALTANAIKGDRERFISYGMDDYLSKPIDKSELDRILNNYLS